MCMFLKIRFGLLAVLLALGLFGGSAIAAAESGPEALWQTFTTADGLPSGNILSVSVAGDGAVWFGTEGGAGRYDGRWQSLTQGSGLPSSRVRAVVQTADGAFWFATDAGLARHVPAETCCRTWRQRDGLPSDDVHTVLAAPASPTGTSEPGVWVGTTRGLVYVDASAVMTDDSAPGGDVQALAAVPDGSILVSLAGEGVWRRTREGAWEDLNSSSLVRPGPITLLIDPGGRVWAGTPGGLAYYEGGEWRPFVLLADEGPFKVLSLCQETDGGLWIGTERGLFLDPDGDPDTPSTVQFRAQPNGLANDHVRAMAFDRAGALWLGTIGGANRYAGAIWKVITEASLAGQRVNAILTDSTGRVWVGTEENGLAAWDGERWRHVTARDGLPDDRIVALFEDGAGRVWVGSGAGIGYFRGADPGQYVRLDAASLAGLPVYSFEQDSDGGLWLATEGGLSHWGESAGFEQVAEFAGKRINTVYRSRDGALWLGTVSDGLFRSAGSGWQPVSGPAGKPLLDVLVNGIRETAGAGLWVGTYNFGLWRLRDGRWEQMDTNLATPKLLALSVAGDDLWIGTRQGAARYDGQTWQSYGSAVLPAAGAYSLSPDRDGSLWVGTLAGLVHYRPEGTPPWVEIESVNSLVPQGGRVTLPGDTLDAIRIRAGDLATRSQELLFLTQLEGADMSPRVQDDTIVTAYARLRLTAGTHMLRVRARDTAFNYSEPAEVQIVVPRFVTLPGGWRLRADVFYPMLVLGLTALGGVMMAGSVSLRARARDRRRAAEAAARQREALERAFNPYISGEPVRQSEMFFGRDELLQRIFNALHRNSIMIHGERRMGKTTMLYQLAEELRRADDPQWAFIPVYVDLEGTPQERFFYHLMEAIWGDLQAYMTEDPPQLQLAGLSPAEYGDREFAGDLRILVERLKEIVAPRQVRVILLLDEMDVVNGYDSVVQQQLRRVFMSSVATNLGAVVAGVRISKAWDRVESPWYNLFNEMALEPFSDAQARALLVEPVKGTYEWEPEAIDFVVAHAEGRPYRLQQYALEAVNRMLGARRLHITLADVEAAHEIIERARDDER